MTALEWRKKEIAKRNARREKVKGYILCALLMVLCMVQWS